MVNATCKADPEDFAALSDELSTVVNMTAINTVVSVLMGMYIAVYMLGVYVCVHVLIFTLTLPISSLCVSFTNLIHLVLL